jgi:hypothetical protein
MTVNRIGQCRVDGRAEIIQKRMDRTGDPS